MHGWEEMSFRKLVIIDLFKYSAYKSVVCNLKRRPRMRYLLILLTLLPFVGMAHPGIGIVVDSKDNIYYTDLFRVWKIKNGVRTLLIPNVHTHELFIDDNDNLYGEGGYYDSEADRHFHYLWVYRPNGKIDTVIGMREDFIRIDFSLTRDKFGNEYYLKRFLPPHTDTNRIYKRSPNGTETVLAEGDFKSVNWLSPKSDGGIIYVSENKILQVDKSGKISNLKDFPVNTSIWSAWEDTDKNIYASLFDKQEIVKIDLQGNLTSVYKSTGQWKPLHGVFDSKKRQWIMESNDKNEIRVIEASVFPIITNSNDNPVTIWFWIILAFVTLVVVLTITTKKIKRKGSTQHGIAKSGGDVLL